MTAIYFTTEPRECSCGTKRPRIHRGNCPARCEADRVVVVGGEREFGSGRKVTVEELVRCDLVHNHHGDHRSLVYSDGTMMVRWKR